MRFDAATLCTFPFDIDEGRGLAAEEEGFARYWSDRRRLGAAVERIVADGVARGEPRDVDPHLTALTLPANDEATQNWFRPARPAAGYDVDTVAALVADLGLRGLLADPTALPAVRAAATV